ncbi:MAG TPA: type II secretion system protein M [Solimonas sp.]|nr:type II secretion system protein M [Solimonas sp.]
MNAYWLRLQSWLAQLAPRERVLVLSGAGVVALTLLYLLIWEPLAKAHAQRAESLEAARALAGRIETAAALVQSQRGSGGAVNRNLSLLAAVDQTSRSPVLGKPPTRVQPEGDREVRVWIDDVSFDNLLRWLQELETRYGIVARSAELERGQAPGTVNARLSLARP